MNEYINKIIQGDCIELLKLMPDKCVDLVLTDPPYNFESMGGGFYSKNKSTSRNYLNKTRENNCCEFNPIQILNILKLKLKKFNAVFCCNKYLVDVYIKWSRENNMLFDIHIISKSNPIPAKHTHFLHDIEYIIYIKESGAFFNSSYPVSFYHKVWKTISRPNNVHPNQKDVLLMQKYIKILSNPNDVILDPFVGSGTTAVAAKQLNRQYIGFELNKEYVDIANKRLSQQTLW